jgi:hypothetical protein
MKTLFIVYGTAICLLFGYASYNGWNVTDSIKAGKWTPHGHSVYHK